MPILESGANEKLQSKLTSVTSPPILSKLLTKKSDPRTILTKLSLLRLPFSPTRRTTRLVSALLTTIPCTSNISKYSATDILPLWSLSTWKSCYMKNMQRGTMSYRSKNLIFPFLKISSNVLICLLSFNFLAT